MVRSPVESLCASLGFPVEERPFRPHLTLARLRRDAKAPAALTAYLSEAAHARYGEGLFDRIVLFRSDLERGGPRHTVLAERALGDGC